MIFQINFKSGMPIYLQLVDQIKAVPKTYDQFNATLSVISTRPAALGRRSNGNKPVE